MTPERWERIEGVFAAVLERSPETRSAYLKEVSQSDAELAKEVESLLRAHDAVSSGFLQSPLVVSWEATPPHALMAGMRLGPYAIVAPLGSGGMGEIYRARDTRLDRDVAIKVLPADLSSSYEALCRFEREAKAVAALSHPNILAIHDIGRQAGIFYAVMELLEGQTLRERLTSKRLPKPEAVDYATQIAGGLAAAHEKDIVHRDLKPENIFITKNGHIKILDFGLAKREPKVAPDAETSAPTVSRHTEPGVVMGTVGYMSPEQVRGQSVDHRSDIFSFGTILYELLSGHRAFNRDTAADTMSAILNDDPPELSGPDISHSLSLVFRRCLEKNRDLRFQSARDVEFALSRVSGQ